MMPVLDGWQVLESLRHDPNAPLAVVLSAASGAENRKRAADLGAAAFVGKPVELASLVEMVEAMAAQAAHP
jgi:CheY-like chemotaxis protein